MANKTIRVRGLVSCAGLWGSLPEGDERDLELDIAESLLRAGHVELVHPPEENAASEKKDAPAPKRKSKRANAS